MFMGGIIVWIMVFTMGAYYFDYLHNLTPENVIFIGLVVTGLDACYIGLATFASIRQTPLSIDITECGISGKYVFKTRKGVRKSEWFIPFQRVARVKAASLYSYVKAYPDPKADYTQPFPQPGLGGNMTLSKENAELMRLAWEAWKKDNALRSGAAVVRETNYSRVLSPSGNGWVSR